MKNQRVSERRVMPSRRKQIRWEEHHRRHQERRSELLIDLIYQMKAWAALGRGGALNLWQIEIILDALESR